MFCGLKLGLDVSTNVSRIKNVPTLFVLEPVDFGPEILDCRCRFVFGLTVRVIVR